MPAADPSGSISRARDLVSHIAAGLALEPEANLSATIAANSIANVFLACVLANGLTETEGEAAATLALAMVKKQGFFDPPGGRPTVTQ